jgi:hypothetical protein
MSTGENMKQRIVISCLLLLFTIPHYPIVAQEKVSSSEPAAEAAEGLNLVAFGELFKGSEDLQAFERAVNNPDVGINNLDLDENDEVDFIRVVEEVADDTHVIVLQALLGKEEFQDIATIEVEKTGDNQYSLQIRGDESIYGADYYVQPADVYVYKWPVINAIYRPLYRPYRSVFYFGSYPNWYRPYRPVHINIYRTRTVKYTARPVFAVSRTGRVKSIGKVRYTRRNSTVVTKRARVTTRSTTVTKGNKSTTVRTTRVRKRP